MNGDERPEPEALLLTWLRELGVGRGEPVGLAAHVRGGVAVAARDRTSALQAGSPSIAALACVETQLRPRWVWWSAASTASHLVEAGLRPATCWDVGAVHRLLAGGSQDGPSQVWALLHDLDVATIPRTGQLDLLSATTNEQVDVDPAGALDSGGHLRAEWVDGGWWRDAARLQAWASLALTAQRAQLELLAGRARLPATTGDPLRTAHSESTAALLCVELAHDGLPIDRARAEQLIAAAVGPRPRDATHEAEVRRGRDELVLRHLPSGDGTHMDLRNPAQVRGALAKAGIDVPDTRSWRLEPWREHHPLVDALLTWRKADRIATTYGYTWLDRYVGPDDRLRGTWHGSDGAAGRMTALAGLHNLPAELRPAVAAEPGFVLVRADLGQIEPRVLAAVSGDPALAAATRDDDLYAPVAARLKVERPVAKLAVLAAMYGGTSGTAGEALAGLERAYPAAMRYLKAAYDQGRAGRPVHTHGGRRVPMWVSPPGLDEQAERSVIAARGRFARNAVVQGAAAEFFKAWAVTVRAGGRPLRAQVVLCLHDELLVHAPQEQADAVVALLHRSLDVVGQAWAPGAGVRFVADVRVVHRWSQAKQ